MDWINILPVGEFDARGRTVSITPAMVREMAANFGRIPDTAIPVNREHKHEHGKLADVVAVKAQPDGLYAALGNWKPGGYELYKGGVFQYVSPEVAWEMQWQGQTVQNVLTGLALTNNPYFGGKAALYSLDTGGRAVCSTGDFVQRYAALVDKFATKLNVPYREALQTVHDLDPDLYAEYARHARIKAGLARRHKATAQASAEHYRALANPSTAGEKLAAAITEYARVHKVRYQEALNRVRQENAALYEAWKRERG